MQLIKNILRDLVEKRLWPVAAGLVVLLAAVPIVLGAGSDANTPAAPAPAAAAGETASSGLVTVADGAPAQRSRAGKLRDPFVQPKVGASATTSTSTSTSTSASGSAATAVTSSPSAATTVRGGSDTSAHTSSPAPSVHSSTASGSSKSTGSIGGGTATPTVAPNSSSPSASAPTTAPRKPAAPPKADVTTVTVDFGLTGALHRHGDIARLAPLPSAANPRFVFLGVLKDRRTAVFLVSSDVQDMLGDGVCRPSPEDCETIELQKGETEFFELTTKDGRSIQYQMDVKDVHVGKVDAAEAVASYARASVAGQKLVRAAALKRGVPALRAYHYLPGQGVLVRAKPRGGARAALSGPRRYVFGPGEVSVFRTLPAAR